MSNSYDKILKENVKELFPILSRKFLGIEVIESEELKDKLQTTIEREADFLRKVKTADGKEIIVQLEFQTHDEKNMILRMQEYSAIIHRKYGLPVKQLVIYLGKKPSKMRTKLQPDEIFSEMTLLNLTEVDYGSLLNSNIAEEVLLAMLGDFKEEKADIILRQIISKMQELSDSKISLQKYIKQLITLSRLRDLTDIIQQTINNMGISYNIENDAFYKQGVETGKVEGKQEGKKEERIAMILTLVKANKLSLEEISEIYSISLKEVKDIAKKAKR